MLRSEKAKKKFAAKALEEVRSKEAVAKAAEAAFAEADADGSGKVSASEISAVLQKALGGVYARPPQGSHTRSATQSPRTRHGCPRKPSVHGTRVHCPHVPCVCGATGTRGCRALRGGTPSWRTR